MAEQKPLMPLLKYAESRGFETRAQAYAAVQSGAIPVVRIGKLLFVPVERADRALGLVEAGAPHPPLRRVA